MKQQVVVTQGQGGIHLEFQCFILGISMPNKNNMWQLLIQGLKKGRVIKNCDLQSPHQASNLG